MGVVSMYTEREKPTLLWVRADDADGSETDSLAPCSNPQLWQARRIR